MSSTPAESGASVGVTPEAVEQLLPLVRRVVLSRVGAHDAADDLIQESMARVLAAVDRIQPETLEAYAITTVRNVVAEMWRRQDRESRNRHRTLDLTPPELPELQLLSGEAEEALRTALARLTPQERQALVAHEVEGLRTSVLASETGTTPGAVAAALHRARARLRVEYLLALERQPPPTPECKGVLLALSSGERRRRDHNVVAEHLLACSFCHRVSAPLRSRGGRTEDQEQIDIRVDSDVVKARQAAKAMAARLRFEPTEATLIATAVSEVTRNIVRFAGSGEVVLEALSTPRGGLKVTARDAGPGIIDVDEAMSEGFSTYDGLGLGLPGARRLMDDFHVESERGRGTTVTMTKWLQEA